MGQSRMDNPETLTHGAIKNGQSRNIDNNGYTKHKMKTNKAKSFQFKEESYLRNYIC
jgi:hypothetical protein